MNPNLGSSSSRVDGEAEANAEGAGINGGHQDSQPDQQDSHPALESRLRNLILKHTSPGVPESNQFPPLPQSSHDSDDSGRRGPEGDRPQIPFTANEAGSRQTGPSPPKNARRRPNQAQRRQMSAQLSLPIDPRAPPPAPAPSSAPYSTASYSNRHGPPSFLLTGHSRQHSGTVDPSQEGRWPQSAGLQSGTSPVAWAGPVHSQPPSDGRFSGPALRGAPQNHGRPQGRRPNHSLGSLPAAQDETSTSRFPYNHRHTQHQPMRDQVTSDVLLRQSKHLETLCSEVVLSAEIERNDIADKESFRKSIEEICRQAISNHETERNPTHHFARESVQLRCFGSLSSGFATKASDMDLGLLSPESAIQPDSSSSPIPRLLEKAFLDAGLGARLLTRTRVPIIKLCERPSARLLADLRMERDKWEAGQDQGRYEAHDDDDLDDGDLDQSPTLRSVEPESLIGLNTEPPQHETKPTATGTADPKPIGAAGSGCRTENCVVGDPQQTRALPRQGEKQSLSSYCSSAKRALRRLGGRDLTASNQNTFNREDCEVLGRVCRDFLEGLHDSALRQRLGSYPSLQFDTIPSEPAPRLPRTLLGVMTQVEGEAMLLQWERCAISDRNKDLERQLETAMRAWKLLRDKPALPLGFNPPQGVPAVPGAGRPAQQQATRDCSGAETVHYGKELQLLLDKMKKARSVQLLLLQQGQFESALHYHNRALKLMSEVMLDPRSVQADLEDELTRRYISGISHADIRQSVDDFYRSASPASSPAHNPRSREARPFADVAIRHRSFQLALELERALSHHLYEGTEAEDVERYIALLRGPLKELQTANGRRRVAVPLVDEESMGLLARVGRVADPSRLAPNQTRDPYRDRLEFPKTGVGVQCDINFSAHLALQNTLLLRCYSHTDSRVRPLVLFVKHWAKVRAINTPYRGTLSSYGYVLMMLHFLVNVARPFVCPNLQQLAYHSKPAPLPGQACHDASVCQGRDVRFWRDEDDIIAFARCGKLNGNTESIGSLLRGFFEYYAQSGPMMTMPCRGFDWGREVLSLRTLGGLVTKQEKGWTGAKTVTIVEQAFSDAARPAQKSLAPAPATRADATEGPSTPGPSAPLPSPLPPTPTAAMRSNHGPQRSREIREVRHRYLFAIEDPFETDHNVARTVTHNGIVAIRDEFRRAWRIIQGIGYGRWDVENLLQSTDSEAVDGVGSFKEFLHDLHGGSLSGAMT